MDQNLSGEPKGSRLICDGIECKNDNQESIELDQNVRYKDQGQNQWIGLEKYLQ